MSGSRSAVPLGATASTRESLLLTAESLFAAHGLDGVSLKQICDVAGQGNRSAIQYHFGSKQGLVDAIFEYRLPAINRRRAAMLADLEAHDRLGDARGLIEAVVVPLAEESEYGAGRYVGFLHQLTFGGSMTSQYRRILPAFTETTGRTLALLASALPDLPRPIRAHRQTLAQSQISIALALRENALRSGDPERKLLPYHLFLSDLLDTLTHAATAPMSESTRLALAGHPATPAT